MRYIIKEEVKQEPQPQQELPKQDVAKSAYRIKIPDSVNKAIELNNSIINIISAAGLIPAGGKVVVKKKKLVYLQSKKAVDVQEVHKNIKSNLEIIKVNI